MNRLQAMQVFVRVVDAGSFTRAAATLTLPRASVSDIIQALESYLQARLLQRTTRRLRLTDDGRRYYARCVRVLAEIEEIESSLSHGESGDGDIAPRGKLRVDVDAPICTLIVAPALDDFHSRYPGIDLTLGSGDRRNGLIAEGVDCAIRLGAPDDAAMVARKLGDFHFLTAAAPAYLQRHGVPASLSELSRHVAVKSMAPRSRRPMELRFVVDGEEIEINIPTAVVVDEAEAQLAVGLRGLGLFQIARILALPHLRSGALVEVLPQWRPAPVRHAIVYPRHRRPSLPLRVFIEWMATSCREHPLLMGPDDHRGQRNAQELDSGKSIR